QLRTGERSPTLQRGQQRQHPLGDVGHVHLRLRSESGHISSYVRGMSEREASERTIVLRGVRTNNLADLDLDIPRNRLVVFVGVSGSGKSSLVFDTIAAEAGHQLNETFPPFARNRLPKWSRPEAEHLQGLTPVIVIDQRRIGGNARS